MRALLVVIAIVLLWYAVLLAWLCLRWPGSREPRIKRPGSFAAGTTIFAAIQSFRLTSSPLSTDAIMFLAVVDACVALRWTFVALKDME